MTKGRKTKKRLERRLEDYKETLKRLTPKQAEGYRRPGSRKK